MICSVAVLAPSNSEPYVTASKMARLFDYQSIGVVLMNCSTAVTDFAVTTSQNMLVSRNVGTILFLSVLVMTFVISSLTFP